MALRGFGLNASGALQGLDQKLDQYTTGPDAVSSILWPNVGTMYASNFGVLVDKLNQRNLSLMMGGFVPGGRAQYDTGQMAHFTLVQSMGARYLGLGQSEQVHKHFQMGQTSGFEMCFAPSTNRCWRSQQKTSRFDNAEHCHALTFTGDCPAPGAQDGRYLAYIEEGTRADVLPGRVSAYAAFRRFSSAIEQLSGDKLFALTRCVFTHYYLQTGLYTLAGAELSGGPQAQLTYAFTRGAAKQYGTLLLSNVCSFTRWGHKVPGDPSPSASCETGADHGDTCGTSYSAMKRMLYTLIMYDTATAGFEVYYYYPPGVRNGSLSPIGRIQARAKNWTDTHLPPERGVHVASKRTTHSKIPPPPPFFQCASRGG